MDRESRLSPKRCVLAVESSEIQTLAQAPRVEVVRGARRVRRRKQISRRRSRPETPLLRWKFEEAKKDEEVVGVESESEKKRCDGGGGCRRGIKKNEDVMVSARKLAAGIWKSQPDLASRNKERLANREGGGEQLGFQLGDGHGGMMDLLHGNGRNLKSAKARHALESSWRNGHLRKIEPSIKMDSSDIEGATKWYPVYPKKSEGVSMFNEYVKPRERQSSAVHMVSELELKLEQAQTRIEELEHEKKSSKKKLESFLRKISDERIAWRSREHEKIRALIDDMKTDLNRERKHRQRAEIINSKLVNELAEAKITVKKYMHEYEKERKARELVEEVCEELAKEIEVDKEDKEDAEALRNECLKIREEVEDERKMLQMAEVWREERVQMKLVDIRVAVEEKYSQMNLLVSALENFLKSRNPDFDSKEIKEAEVLRRAVASLNIRDVRDFSYEPPKAEDIFAVFQDVNMAEMQEKEIKACVYSPASNVSKIHAPSPRVESPRRSNIQRQRNELLHNNRRDTEGDESGWETVSQLEDEGSSYSPDGSIGSVNKGCRNSNASRNGPVWEEKAGGRQPKITEITEVSPVRHSKKGSTISTRLWKQNPNSGGIVKIISVEGVNDGLSDGRQSNGSIHSLDQGSAKGVYSPSYLMGLSSPDSRNPNYNKGMKGCMEWPRGVAKNNLKAKLMAARIESQKVQLRQVLKQKY